MSVDKNSFNRNTDLEVEFIPDHDKLASRVKELQDQGKKVVLTMGSFDLLHVGHGRYIRKAKKLGEVLIVGLETDEKVRRRKAGYLRPVIPEDERLEMLGHTRYVNILTMKDVTDEKWKLIKLLRPDVLQAVEGTYTDEEITQLKQYCSEVIVQERQAETSTSAKIRMLVIGGLKDFTTRLLAVLPEFVTEFYGERVRAMNSEFCSELPEKLKEIVAKHEEDGVV